jgi:chitinase
VPSDYDESVVAKLYKDLRQHYRAIGREIAIAMSIQEMRPIVFASETID